MVFLQKAGNLIDLAIDKVILRSHFEDLHSHSFFKRVEVGNTRFFEIQLLHRYPHIGDHFLMFFLEIGVDFDAGVHSFDL